MRSREVVSRLFVFLFLFFFKRLFGIIHSRASWVVGNGNDNYVRRCVKNRRQIALETFALSLSLSLFKSQEKRGASHEMDAPPTNHVRARASHKMDAESNQSERSTGVLQSGRRVSFKRKMRKWRVLLTEKTKDFLEELGEYGSSQP